MKPVKGVYERLGERIREMREAKGLSQECLAVGCGLKLSHVGGIERGEVNITVESLAKVALGLRIPISTLVEGIANMRRGQKGTPTGRPPD